MGSVRQVSDVKVMLVKGGNGKGISKIEKTGTSGLVDTYTITYTDGSKTTYQVTNGNGIDHIAKTSTSGTTDTYTIYYTDGTTWTYDVENGGGQSGHTIEDDGVAMTDRSALDFIDHDLTDDSVNDATKVAPHRLSSSEMSEICFPLPDAPTLVGNMRMTKLWENPDPTQSFSAQNVTLSSGDYDLLCVVARLSASLTFNVSAFTPKGNGVHLVRTDKASTGVNIGRNMEYASDTTVHFVDAYRLNSTDNTMLIPYCIYGIKLL
jgi:hypothetical protein